MSEPTSTSQNTPTTTQPREIKEKIRSKDKATQLSGLSELKNILSQPHQSEDIIDESLLLNIIQFLNQKDDLELQVEGSGLLSELFSKESEYCRIINKSKEFEQLINAMDFDNHVVLENVLSAINSLLAEDPDTRKVYISKGCLKKIPLILKKHPIPPIKKNIIQFLFYMTKGKPLPKWHEIKPTVCILQEAIKGMQSGTTLSHALSCVAAITEADHIGEIINLGFVPFLVQHVYNQDTEIFFPALRALGNIITGDDQQTEEVLALPDFLVRLFELILNPDKSIQKEICWILSNIAAGSESQKRKIIYGPNYMDALKHALSQGDEKVAIEASWVYSNLLDKYQKELANDLIEKYDYMECLSIMFSKNNPKIDELALEALRNILTIKHPKINDFLENNFADKVSHINPSQKNKQAIEEIEYLLEEMGFGNLQLKLGPRNPGPRKKPAKEGQENTQDEEEEEENEYENEENEDDDQNED